ncbi:MAG: tetratricopeptide repeat protein [Bacteroidales bacterium]|nr:tetratricopeptide repeat protein [Bacteroidales bacterium]
MKPIIINIILAVAIIAGNITPSPAQSAEQIYQKGLMKEEGEGALQEAIVLYNQVTDNSTAEISLRAKALLHTGMCYEKLGTQEAVKAYQRLVTSFPTQKNEVAIARERLMRLMPVAINTSETLLIPNFAKIRMPGNPDNGMLSPDGKKIAFISEGDVWIVPVSGGVNPYITGEPKRLTKNIGAWDNMSNSFCWSGNGKWIAFNAELDQMSSTTSIYVIPADGGDAQKVQVPSHYCGWPAEFRLSLSPDGKILAYVSGWKDYKTKSAQIYTIPVSGGAAKELTGPGTLEPIWSPDGKKIAFTAFAGGDSELWMMENFLPIEKLQQQQGSEVAKASEGISIKQVWTGPEVGDFCSISKDGKYLSFVDLKTGEVAIRNLETKGNKLLTKEGSWDKPYHWADVNLITGDAEKIVYSWYNEDENYDLRLLEIDNPSPEVIYKPKTPEQIFPKLLFSDDKKVIVQRFNPSETWYLASVNLENGDIINLKDFEGNSVTNLSLSPNPKYFGFDFRNKDDELRFDIHLLSTDGKEELPLVDHPANDRLIGWLPGRDVLLFTSDRSGSSDLWALNTAKLTEPGEPRLILKNIGDISPLGFNNDGNLFYSVEFRKYNSYIVPMDQNEGKLQFKAKEPLFGSMRDPVWFADGKHMLYTEYSIKPGGLQDHTLILNNTETGNSRHLADNIASLRGTARLSPDEKSVLVFGYDKSRMNDKKYKGGIYKIDIDSGIATEIKVAQDASHTYSVEWDKNGENIFYISNNQIVKHNIKTGNENVIFEGEGFGAMTILKRSADGKTLLFDLQEGENERHLMSISLDGGGLQTISKFNIPSTHLMYKMLAFSPEGDCIYFSNGTVLWKIPYTGSNPEEVWHSENHIAGLSIHPDGTKMVLSLYEREVEIRAIENLGKEVTKLLSRKE